MGRFSDLLKKGFKQQEPPPPEPSPSETVLSSQEHYYAPALEKNISAQNNPIRIEAKTIYDEALSLISELFTRLSSDQEFQASKIYKLVENVVDNINLNYQPLLTLSFNNSHDCYLYAHSVNVMILALLVGKELNYSKDRLMELGIGAFLHDIGLVKFLPKINSNVKLSPQEYEDLKLHPVLGVEMADKLKIMSQAILSTIREEHERIDGKGYPERLKDGDISEYARIVGLVDVYEALTHFRPFRDLVLHHGAIEEIMKYQSDAFDVNLVRALMRIVGIFIPGTLVELNTNEIAKVTDINKDFPLRPMLSILFDGRRQKLSAPRNLDLSKNYSIYIKRPIEVKEELLLNL